MVKFKLWLFKKNFIHLFIIHLCDKQYKSLKKIIIICKIEIKLSVKKFSLFVSKY